MSDSIIVALITSGVSLLGIIVTNRRNARGMEHKLEVRQAVTDTKIEELTREVRLHNNFAQRMPVVEQEIKDMSKTMEKLQAYHME